LVCGFIALFPRDGIYKSNSVRPRPLCNKFKILTHILWANLLNIQSKDALRNNVHKDPGFPYIHVQTSANQLIPWPGRGE